MLDDLGVLDALMERGIVSTGFQYRDRRTGPIADLDLGVLSEDTRYPFRVQCEQCKLTPILLEVLERHGQRDGPLRPAAWSRPRPTGVRRRVTTEAGDTFTADWVLGRRRRQLAGAADRRRSPSRA